MNEINGNLALDKGLVIEQYKEIENQTQYAIFKTYVNDGIEMDECIKIFNSLKDKGIIKSEKFNDWVWIFYNDMYELNYYLDFGFAIEKETIISIKKYLLVKAGIKNVGIQSIKKSYNYIFDMLYHTKKLDKEYLYSFKKYIFEEKDIAYLSCIKEFLKFSNIENAAYYLKELQNCHISPKTYIRKIPNFESIMKYDFIFKDIINNGKRELVYKYYPILMWWCISTIIPLRPSEFVILKRDCVYVKDNNYYLHIERIKAKSKRNKFEVPIMKDFKIPQELYQFIFDFIDFANEIDNSEYLISYDYYKKFLNKDIARKSNKITINKMSYLFDRFEKEVIEDLYNYKIVEIGASKDDLDIERLKLGDTRHLAFMNMLMQGLNPLYIQRIGGHYTIEEQMYYCSHIDNYMQEKTYVLSKVINEKQEVFVSNCNTNVDWGLKEIQRESMGLSFYSLPLTNNNMGRCTSTNFPNECQCEECLFCKHFIPEKNVSSMYLMEQKLKNQKNIELKKELLQRLLKSKTINESKVGETSMNLSSLINQNIVIDAYIMNQENKGEIAYDK